MKRLPLYFFNNSQPFTDLHAAAIAAGFDWGELCTLVEVPDENEDAFYSWLLEYFSVRAEFRKMRKALEEHFR